MSARMKRRRRGISSSEPDLCIASADDLAEQVEQAVEVYCDREVEGDADLPGGTNIVRIPALSERCLEADVSECFPDGAIPTGTSVWKDRVEIVISLASVDVAAQRAVYEAEIGEILG